MSAVEALTFVRLDRTLGFVRDDEHGPVVASVEHVFFWDDLGPIEEGEPPAAPLPARIMRAYGLDPRFHWQALAVVRVDG